MLKLFPSNMIAFSADDVPSATHFVGTTTSSPVLRTLNNLIHNRFLIKILYFHGISIACAFQMKREDFR